MTNQEALEVIKLAQEQHEWEYPMDYATAFDMAISALEKQIPKKPTNCIWYGDGSAMGHCPMCDTFLDSDSDAHCCGCGQAILWSEGD